LAAGDYPRALSAADAGLQLDANDPWGHYDRGCALRGLKRTDEAVAELRRAQVLFGDRDRWGRSVALWGEADAFREAGRCPEARRAFDSYASFVQGPDPASAELARQYASECVPAR
jgi:hypothetical protein